MLCPLCQNLPPLAEFNPVVSHHTLRSLQLSASDGCECCELIWRSLEPMASTQKILAGDSPQKPEEAEVALEYGPLATMSKGDRSICQYIWVSPSAYEQGGSKIELFINRGESTLDVIDGRSVASSHDSDGTFDFIHEAVETCTTCHEHCAKNINVILPTFVIDIGTAGTMVTPRLLENDGALRGTYLTLSYCWGGPQLTQLTTGNLESHKGGIPLISLPETIRDAIAVTRKLGYQYLWIDALCIIQDDEMSKEKEIARMGHIYRNSFLTIQASATTSVNDGFLAWRLPPTVPPIKLVFEKHNDGYVSYVHARLRNDESRSSPTSSRAWIFQESILPIRLLVYTKMQVILCCREKISREDGMQHGALDISPLSYRQLRSDVSQDAHSSPDTIRESALINWYWQVGTFYSKRFHSVNDDRLNAIAGYAEDVHHVIGGQYLAGLWDADLVLGLGWKRVVKSLKKAVTYRAPSWSWAAYDGQITYSALNITSSYRKQWNKQYGGRNPDPHFEPRVLKAWTTTTGISQFSACRDGRIVIETLVGWVTPKILTKDHKSYSSGAFLLQTKDGAHDVCIAWADTDDGLPASVLCASLTGIAGLLLVESNSNQNTPVFQRVGVFKLTYKCDYAVFEEWRQSCRLETIAMI